jgi:CubicO group peptidase (beta-lactamase class C family)
MRRWKLFATLLAVALFASLAWQVGRRSTYASVPAPPLRAADAAPLAAPQHAEAMAQARALAKQWMAERGYVGLSISVGVKGEIVWSEGFGHADLEQQVPVTRDTKFRIGSVSKSVTAAALAQLFEQGKLDLDAPVQRYVPGFPDKGKPVSIRQLAGHLAGIRHYKGDEFLLARRFNSVTESLAIFKDDPLLFDPGTRYSYSSYGWNLLSAVVEGASGQNFLDYMRANVFERLALKSMAADENDKIIAHRTRFYQRNSAGAVTNAPYVDNSYKWAGGGFLSTTDDLVRFAFAHLQPGFLKAETLAVLFTSQKTNVGELTNYGIGWSVRADDKGRRTVSHSGGSVGGTTMLLIYPDSGIVVAMAVNMSSARLGASSATQIADLFMR